MEPTRLTVGVIMALRRAAHFGRWTDSNAVEEQAPSDTRYTGEDQSMFYYFIKGMIIHSPYLLAMFLSIYLVGRFGRGVGIAISIPIWILGVVLAVKFHQAWNRAEYSQKRGTKVPWD